MKELSTLDPSLNLGEGSGWSFGGLFEAIKLASLVRQLNLRTNLLRGFKVSEIQGLGAMELQPSYRKGRRWARIEASTHRRHAKRPRPRFRSREASPAIDGRSTKVLEAIMRARPGSACNHTTELIRSDWRS